MEDQFEFRPLSEGLGFHKKVIDLREEGAQEPNPSTKPLVSKPVNQAAQTSSSYVEPAPWKPALPQHDIGAAVPDKAAAPIPAIQSQEDMRLTIQPCAVSWP